MSVMMIIASIRVWLEMQKDERMFVVLVFYT
jgi:hypothetical protein